MNHRHEQVGEEQQRDDSGDNYFHSCSLKPVAKADVSGAQEEKENHRCNKDKIAHNG
jgi:hypothetical protein